MQFLIQVNMPVDIVLELVFTFCQLTAHFTALAGFIRMEHKMLNAPCKRCAIL